MTAPERVLWIGGRSGAGKSTVARLLARRHGLRLYSCDTRTWEHRDRAITAGDPAAIEWERLTPEQRSQLAPADAIRLSLDRSAMVAEDVAALPDSVALVVEGTPIEPRMIPAGSLAVWLLADPAIRSNRTRQRGWGAGGGALDRIKEQELHDQLVATGATMINSTDDDPSATLFKINLLAADWLATQPTASSRAERRDLIRESNAAIVRQYRSGLGRSGSPARDGLIRSYDCECGSITCTEFVDRPLASLPDPFDGSSPPIFAPGHETES